MTHRWPFLITIFVKITFTYVVYTVSVQLCQDGYTRNFIFSYHVFPRLDIQVFYYLSGRDMFPHSSSSYSGRMLIHEPDSIGIDKFDDFKCSMFAYSTYFSLKYVFTVSA